MTIKVKIKKIINHTEKGFLVTDVEFLTYPEGETPPTANHIMTGNYFMGIDVGDVFEVAGSWINGRYGYQFAADSIALKFPERLEGLEKFLMTKVAGVGKKSAKALVNTFGGDVLEIIINAPERLTESGISQKIADRIKKQLDTVIQYNKNYMEIGWLRNAEVNAIIKEYGFGAASVVMDSPYNVADIIGFERCDYAATCIGLTKDNPKRVTQAILEALKAELRNGNLYTDKAELLKATQGILTRSKYYKEFKIEEPLFLELFETLKERNKIDVEKDRVYLRFSYVTEDKIVKAIKEVRNVGQDFRQEEKVREFLREKREAGIILEEEQEKAVLTTIKSNMSVLTGGPGTGKTFTAGVLIEAIKKTQPGATIVLAAPTGKAAKVMERVTGMPSSTIHRLIGVREEKDVDVKEIDSNYVIIDEASMLDVFLFAQLLSAITPRTKLVLMGDANQLPSVGAGLILRDLIESNSIPTTTLVKIQRQAAGSQIIQNAYNAQSGKRELAKDDSKGDFYFLEREGAENIKNAILKSIDRMIETGYATLDEIQVITPQNIGDLGADIINKEIQKNYNKNKGEIKIGKLNGIKIGDKVLHNENNADLGVYNGETGKVIRIEDGIEKEITVDFGEKEVTYTEEFFQQLQLAYALSVHKMQGSESKVVIMIVSKEHRFMLNKSIIYTGMTRARERLIIIGEEEEHFEAIKRTENTIRRSGIREKVSA